MGRTIHEIMKAWPAERRARVEANANRLIDEFRTLQDLRKARELTQVKVAALLGIKQENVSRVEKRTDMLLSTLREYVVALGGKLELVVEFKNRSPVLLTSIMDPTGEISASAKTGAPRPLARRKGAIRATTVRSTKGKSGTSASREQ